MLIDFFLDKDCTLIVPAHDYSVRIAYSPSINIFQNGLDRDNELLQSCNRIYSLQEPDISPEMGTVAKHIFLRKDSVTGYHPENAFTGLGPLAETVIRSQTPWNVYGPYDRIMAYDDALILLLGVDLSKATPVHYAEYLSGRNPFIRWFRDKVGVIHPMRVGACSDGFNACYPFVSHLDICKSGKKGIVKIFPFKDLIQELVKLFRHKPEITRCTNPQCPRCRDILKGGPYYSFKEIKL